VNDPGSKSYCWAGRWGSAIEIPKGDQDIYALKKVQHGKVSQNIYFSEITKERRKVIPLLLIKYITLMSLKRGMCI